MARDTKGSRFYLRSHSGGKGHGSSFSTQQQDYIADRVNDSDDIGALFGSVPIVKKSAATSFSPTNRSGWILVVPIACNVDTRDDTHEPHIRPSAPLSFSELRTSQSPDGPRWDSDPWRTDFNWIFSLGSPFGPVDLPRAIGGSGFLTYRLDPEVPGLSFDPATRLVTGTPTRRGIWNMTYKATDENGAEAVMTFKWFVREDCRSSPAHYAFNTINSDGVIEASMVAIIVRKFDDETFRESIWHPDNEVMAHEFMHAAGHSGHTKSLRQGQSVLSDGTLDPTLASGPPTIQGKPYFADRKWADLVYEPTFASGTLFDNILGTQFYD